METVLVLRTCRADMSSPSNVKFRWPESGPVEAPDWKPTEECGNGLHGALWGEGDGSLFCWEPDAKWLVVAVDLATIVDLAGKVKYPRGEVVHCGDRSSATEYIAANGGAGRAIIGGSASATGYRGSASATGYRGSASAAGYMGSASAAGYMGSASATGDMGSASATGDMGSASATGYRGSASAAGYRGSASATGYRGSASAAGYMGSASATGYGGSASATGYMGSASATGDMGSASATGYGGSASAGENGTIHLRWWDDSANRYRTAVGYIGEDGLEPGVMYRLVDGKFAAVADAKVSA